MTDLLQQEVRSADLSCYRSATNINKNYDRGSFNGLFHTSGGGGVVDVSGGTFGKDFNVYNNRTVNFRGAWSVATWALITRAR